MTQKIDKAILTLATGKPLYLDMAVNLARSFQRWHPNSEIQFVLATDQPEQVPMDLKDKIHIVVLKPGELGLGFSPKLHLDRLTPAEKTLFIDADCLCFGSLTSVFDRFAGRAVSAIGKSLVEGDFFGDVATICRHFEIPSMPYFVGGMYYIEKGDLCDRVYTTARALEPQYDELGLIRLRGRPNEEPLIAIAMALHGQTPIPEDGSIKAEPMFYPSGFSANVYTGKTHLRNLPSHPKYSTVWGLQTAEPIIVHFHDAYANRAVYQRECLKLQLAMVQGWPEGIANAYAFGRYSVPEWLLEGVKNLGRPLYRSLFGVRRIQPSQRIVEPSSAQ